MTLEQQVCSLELAKKLKELGVKQESLWWWIFDNTHTSSLRISDRDESHHRWAVKWRWQDNELFERLPDKDKASAFTVAELGEMLPPCVQWNEKDRTHNHGMFFGDLKDSKHESGWHIQYIGCFGMIADTEADARAKMLIHLIENNLWRLGETLPSSGQLGLGT